jgi:CBS domain-containing protein
VNETAAREAPPVVLHLTDVVGGKLLESSGEQLGRVNDLVVRLGDDEYPPVSGVLATVARRQVWVPAAEIGDIQLGKVTLSGPKLDLRRFERRPQEILLKEDILDRQVIDVEGADLVRANEIELARLDGWYRVVGIDVGLRGFTRRLLPRVLGGHIGPGGFLDWASIEPFTGHVPTVRLTTPHPKLARLHPVELADLVEAASRAEGGEIVRALKDDREREADVLEELGADHRAELIEQRTDAEVADLLTRMESDDAADLLSELPDERREPIIDLLPRQLERRLRTLMGYDEATAGGLMSPDFLCLYTQATREEALDRVARSLLPHETLAYIFVMNQHRRLRGAIDLVDLLRAAPGTSLGQVEHMHTMQLKPEDDATEIARILSDYDLTAAPVVDDETRMIGIVTVDDVLELILPRRPRRPFGSSTE